MIFLIALVAKPLVLFLSVVLAHLDIKCTCLPWWQCALVLFLNVVLAHLDIKSTWYTRWW